MLRVCFGVFFWVGGVTETLQVSWDLVKNAGSKGRYDGACQYSGRLMQKGPKFLSISLANQ